MTRSEFGRSRGKRILLYATIAAVSLGILAACSFGWVVVYVARMEATIPTASIQSVTTGGLVYGYNRTVYDCIIILGAQVKPTGVPSEALLRRMTLALDFYREKPALIITTGGQGQNEPVPEGEFIRAWLLRQGVPDEQIICDNLSRNTRENIANAQAIMTERGLGRALVITSDYHLPRALAVCADQGVAAVGAGSESAPEMWWNNHIRESLSWVKYKLGF